MTDVNEGQRYLTLVLKVDTFPDISFGAEILGGVVVGAAAFDAITKMADLDDKLKELQDDRE